MPRVYVRVSCSDGEKEHFGLYARPFPAFLLLILKSNEISHKLFLDETACLKKRTINSTGTEKNTILYCPFQRQGNLLCGGLQKVRKSTTRTTGIYIYTGAYSFRSTAVSFSSDLPQRLFGQFPPVTSPPCLSSRLV